MKEVEEAATDRWATAGADPNIGKMLLFVSLFEKSKLKFLAAGTPGFAYQAQLTTGGGYSVENIWFFLFCDWRTAWTLLFKPIDKKERKEIDKIVKVSF